MQANKFSIGKFHSIICKAQDLALRMDQQQISKYQNSRVIGSQLNHQDLNQLWHIWNPLNKDDSFEITNEISALVFDEQSGQIRLKPAKQKSDQLFAIVRAPVQAFYQYFWIKTSIKGDKALSLEGILRYKNFDPNDETQLFRFQEVNDNTKINQTSIIINNYTGKAVDVAGWTRTKGQGLIQYTKTKRFNQRWTFQKRGKGVIIKSLYSGLLLDISEGKMKNGTKIIQWEQHGGDNQIWIPDIKNGLYRFRSAASSNFFLSVKDQNVQDYGKLEITDQQNPTGFWKLQGVQL